MRRTKQFNSKGGQMRILETIIAAAIIYIVFSAAIFMIKSSETVTSQETTDLNKLGYNVLHRMMEARTIEETLEKLAENGTDYLKNVVQKFLPTGVYFRLMIYNCTGNFYNNTGEISSPFSNSWNVSNAALEEFVKLKEVAFASTIYTSKMGNIYYLVLNVARAGQG